MMHCGRTIYGSEYYIYDWIVKYEWTLQEFKSRITIVSILALSLRIGIEWYTVMSQGEVRLHFNATGEGDSSAFDS